LSDARQQALVLHEIAQIEELHLRDLEAAQKRYQTVLQRHPQYETAAVALIHVAEARGDWAAAAEQLALLAERTTHTEAKMALVAQLGLVYEHRLDEPARAARCYTQAIESSKIGRVFSLAELRATAAASSDDGAALVGPLRRLGARCTDIRLAHGYRALAALRDEVTAGAAGPELYVDAGRLEQADPLVAQGIVRALASVPEEQWGGWALPDALVAAADICSNAPVKTLMLFEAALRLDRASRPEAMAVYEQAAQFIPDFLPVLRGRRRLATAAGDWANAAKLLAREAELAADRGDRIRALMTAGAITLEKINDRSGALGHYRRLLELEPAHEDAFIRARELLEEQKDDAGLLELVVARAAATANVRERATMLKLQAELHRDRMKDSRSAVAALKQAIALTPDDLDAYMMLAPLEEEQRWWQGAADCYRKIAELTPGSDTSRTVRLREAAIREDELGDREAARNILEELIIDDTDRQAARQMAQLCLRMGKRARARELFLHAAKTGTIGEKIEDLLAAARVPVDSVNDEAGVRATQEAFQIAVAQKEGVAVLAAVYEKLGDWNGFVRAAERTCETTHRGDGLVPLRLMLATVYAERLNRLDLAVAQLQAARTLAPNDAALTQRLAQLQLASGHADRAIGEFRRALVADPFNPSALRGLGDAVRSSLPECSAMFAALAELAEGRVVNLPPPPR
ncbi:MAG: tetratricopeptide repeat protein, partial [Polyangia bacterium]